MNKKIQKRYDEEFKRQAVELVIRSGKRKLTFNLLCLICYGLKRRYSEPHKGHSASGRGFSQPLVLLGSADNNPSAG